MLLYFWPRTRLGKWSAWLFIIFAGLFAVFLLLVASGQRGGDTFFDNMALSLPMSVAGICGIFSFFTGITGIVRSKERALLVFISTAIGSFILVFILGEFLFPH